MAYGEQEAWLAEEAAAGNRVALKAFEMRPGIGPHLQFVWNAFWELSSGRPSDVIGERLWLKPIPFSAVDDYAQRFGPEGVEHFARFLKLIRRLDGVYLSAVNKAKS
jgi:hypothetical protein